MVYIKICHPSKSSDTEHEGKERQHRQKDDPANIAAAEIAILDFFTSLAKTGSLSSDKSLLTNPSSVKLFLGSA